MKGDLHFHSNLSDGTDSPEEMFECLRTKGFDFCCLADHDLPTAECADFNGLLVLSGQELSSESGHIVALGSQFRRRIGDTIAVQLAGVRNDGGVAILSHPRIREFISEQGLHYDSRRLCREFPGLYDAIEIYTHNVGSGFKLAIDRLDLIWTTGLADDLKSRPRNQLPVWGTASSDGHCHDHIQENVGVFVLSAERTEQGIMEALRRGAFYASANSEARFLDIREQQGVFRVRTANAVSVRAVAFRGLTVGFRSFPVRPETEFVHRLKGDEKYVRFEAEDANGRAIYSNPVML